MAPPSNRATPPIWRVPSNSGRHGLTARVLEWGSPTRTVVATLTLRAQAADPAPGRPEATTVIAGLHTTEPGMLELARCFERWIADHDRRFQFTLATPPDPVWTVGLDAPPSPLRPDQPTLWVYVNTVGTEVRVAWPIDETCARAASESIRAVLRDLRVRRPPAG